MATTTPASAREIQIRVRDGDGALLRGTVISWTEDDDPRGTIDPSDGHATVSPVSPTSIVGVTVDYDGDVQSRKLAIDQTVCEFDYPDVRLQAPLTGAAPAPPSAVASAAPPTPAPAPLANAPSPWWMSSTVIAAAVTAIGAVIVAIVQYWPGLHDKVTLKVYVKDAATSTAIPYARVGVQSANVSAPVLADSQGVAVFELPSGKGESMKITGSAAHYEDGVVVTRASEQPVELLLQPVGAPPAVAPRPAPPTSTAVAQPGPGPTAIGTWEVRVSGNIALKRVQSGSFDFAVLPDGHTAVRGEFDLDGSTTRLDGAAARQNDRLFLTYSAQTGAESWHGQGQLTLTKGAMQGYLTDSKGQQVPIFLRKP